MAMTERERQGVLLFLRELVANIEEAQLVPATMSIGYTTDTTPATLSVTLELDAPFADVELSTEDAAPPRLVPRWPVERDFGLATRPDWPPKDYYPD